MQRGQAGTLFSVAFASGSDSTALHGTLGRSAQQLKGALGNYRPGVSSAIGQVLCLPPAWVLLSGLTFPWYSQSLFLGLCLFPLPAAQPLCPFLCLFPSSLMSLSPHLSLLCLYMHVHTHRHTRAPHQMTTRTTHIHFLFQKHPRRME